VGGFHPIQTMGHRMGYRNRGVNDSAGYNTQTVMIQHFTTLATGRFSRKSLKRKGLDKIKF